MHPILESLRSTDNRWLIDTLYAFNSGDVEAFFILKGCWDSQTDLAANESKLKEKLQLLCLMEMVFTRPAHHRQITFQEISSQAKLPVNKVELLVMKALSNGLVKGSIDEVDSKVHLTWVQPRVMDLKQANISEFQRRRINWELISVRAANFYGKVFVFDRVAVDTVSTDQQVHLHVEYYELEVCCCIAGGMYQVLPAVGADGKNILKLIPVQKADGKYIRSVTSTNAASSYKQAVVEPARVVTPTDIHFTTTDISQSQLPMLQQTSQIKYILKSPSNGPVTLNHMGRRPAEGNGTLPSTSSSVQVSPGPVLPRLNQNLVLVPTSMVSSEGTYSTLNPKQLPITLKSSVFPNGHLLQIPVNAKVKTVPASALPPVIQQKIHATSVSSGSGTPEPKTNLHTVLYVTPVNTVRMATTKPTIHPSPTAESQSPNLKTTQQSVKTTPVKGPSGPSRFCSSNNQSQGKPIKWVVEEYPDSPAPYIVPVNKPNKNIMSTNIFKSIEKSAENAAPPPAVSQETQSQISSGKDNALVMCNGKVFFLAKKSPELIVPPVQKQDANEAAQRINTEMSQSTDCVKHAEVDFEIVSTQSLRSATSGAVVPGSARRDDTTPIIITDDADDLSSEVQEVGYSKPDVIFVSYIKPKKLPVANVEGGSVPEILTIKDDEPEKVEVKVDEGKPAPQKRKSESSPPSTKKSRVESPERNCEADCTAQSPITSTPEPPSLSLPTANPSTGMMETEEAVPSCSETLGAVSQELSQA
ncbi:UNVERIFIED_CONTAM: hypothetical protein FKN15_024379 [Acipenser sinensis]